MSPRPVYLRVESAGRFDALYQRLVLLIKKLNRLNFEPVSKAMRLPSLPWVGQKKPERRTACRSWYCRFGLCWLLGGCPKPQPEPKKGFVIARRMHAGHVSTGAPAPRGDEPVSDWYAGPVVPARLVADDAEAEQAAPEHHEAEPLPANELQPSNELRSRVNGLLRERAVRAMREDAIREAKAQALRSSLGGLA